MLRCVLRYFEAMTRLYLNFAKSFLIAVGVVLNLDQFTADLGCRAALLPPTYLGLPLGSHYKQNDVWGPVIDRMRKHLARWKTCYLSKRGRLTLIKSSLASILTYNLLVFVAPKSVCNIMEQIQRDFLWKRGEDGSVMHLVAWNRVCTPKGKGGTGIRRLQPMNQALLCKRLRRFREKEDNLWRRVVVARYGVQNIWLPMTTRGVYECSPWRGIVNYFDTFRQGLSYEIGDGRHIKFCEDVRIFRRFFPWRRTLTLLWL